MVDLLMTIIIILITSILPKLKAIQARPARMKPSAPAPGFEATVDWVGVGGVFFSLFFSLLFLPTCQLDWSMTTNPKNQKKLPIPRIHSDSEEAKPTTLELVIRALLSAS